VLKKTVDSGRNARLNSDNKQEESAEKADCASGAERAMLVPKQSFTLRDQYE